uniref:Uncharacterized protein n=1 Tax=Caenorhabditis tropicalis TaxID=1561998 RepID=A0A1I7U3I9_9PELO
MSEKCEVVPRESEEIENEPKESYDSGVIEKNLNKLDLKEVTPDSAENGETSLESEKTKLRKEQEIEKLEKQIDEYVKLFEDPGATFEQKLRALVEIPKEVEFQHRLLNRERADLLFSSIPVEMIQRVFEPKHEEYSHVRPILIHIMSFLCQCTNENVHRKFKPLMPNIVASVCPRGNKTELSPQMYSDTSLIVGIWADQNGDGKCIYDLLRYMTSFCAAQKNNLDVGQFLLCIRTLIQKIFQVAPLESQEQYDNRGWTVGILAVIRRLLQERTNKFTKELRKLLWEVISSMTRVGGIGWFNIDKTFAKLAIQMNFVELQMALNDVNLLDSGQFCTHLRILELYTSAICDSEMFGEEGMEIIPQTVGDASRFILSFWVETYLQKIKLPTQMALSIYNFAVFIFCHEDLTIQEEKVRKNFGAAILETSFQILEESSEVDLKREVGVLFNELLERLTEFEVLTDNVPVFMLQYLDRIRIAEDYEGWKQRVTDCKCCVMDLRGRVDWYSIKSLNEAKTYLPRFTDPEQHELGHLFSIFDKLPRVN